MTELAIERSPLRPFGVVLTLPEGTEWSALPPEDVHAWVADHRVVVIRGLRAFEKRDLPAAARRLGPLLAWSFGAVNELKPSADTKNYLYTNREVPLHWDGAFLGIIPRYLFFHCLDAPDVDGGETVFVDTTRVWSKADVETRDKWRALTFVYETDKVVHYGGAFRARVVSQHPYTQETILRFAEPVDDLNPVTVRAENASALESAHEITALRRALSADDAVLAHAWHSGDVVIADNHALLHGRRAFAGGERRHIRRVNVCGPERTWRDSVRQSIRIRRPEFMVAEIPILLIPALLVAAKGQLASWMFAELTVAFFLLFHFGDMINCLADRDLDAVYKTHLSESIYGLGVRNVRWQIALTVLAALLLGAHLSWLTGRWELAGLIAFGLLLGSQYSVGPVRAKGRGLLQVLTLWAVIFAGPMLLVALTFGAGADWPLLALIAGYGMMQEGIILVNTAEDLPEDTADGIRTSAVALGLSRCIALSTIMVFLGGLSVIGLLAGAAWLADRSIALAVTPLFLAWLWVVWEIHGTWRRVVGKPLGKGIDAMRPRARRMPFWITATAWTSLWAALYLGTDWFSR